MNRVKSSLFDSAAGAATLAICIPSVLWVLDRNFGLTNSTVTPDMLRRAAWVLMAFGMVLGAFLGRAATIVAPVRMTIVASIAAAIAGVAGGIWVWVVTGDFIFQPWTALAAYGLSTAAMVPYEMFTAARDNSARRRELLKQFL